MRKLFRFAPFAVLVLLWGCGGEGTTDGAPSITSFTASSSSVAAGDQVTLSWVIDGGSPTSLTIDPEPGSVSGTSADVFVDETTTYTLTASNASGTDTETTTVTVSGGGEGEPTGTFGVSASEAGPFQNDEGGLSGPTDPRVLTVPANSTFYAQAVYSDPDGITEVVPYLANDNIDVPLAPGFPVRGFTSSEPMGCTLDGTATEVTCTFAIEVGDIPNISEIDEFEGEFAYVFKVNVTDAAGTVTANSTQGYVIVTGGTDPTDPTVTTDPTAPTDDPTAPTDDPTAPTDDPTAPTDDPTAPTDDPTAPTDDPTAPTDDPTAPTDDPTAPTDDPTAPTDDPTAPTDDPTAPTDDPTAPTDDPTAPTDDPTEPEELHSASVHQYMKAQVLQLLGTVS